MKTKKIVLLTVILCGLGIVLGCAKYKIWYGLKEPIKQPSNCSIGEIIDALPSDFDEDEKPTLVNIDELREYLAIELQETGIFQTVLLSDPEAEFQVTGSILHFKKGSSGLRLFRLFLPLVVTYLKVGNAKLEVRLELEDPYPRNTLFSGVFKQEVRDPLLPGDVMFEGVAKDFAKALKKQSKKFRRRN